MRDEAPNLKTKFVIMCCLVRAVAQLTSGDGDGWMCSNSGMISREKPKIHIKPAPMSLCAP
jgi:hypothetical protein